MIEAADVVTDACSSCHDRYRDRRGGVAGRCK
jgi:cytochrome c556